VICSVLDFIPFRGLYVVDVKEQSFKNRAGSER
jgi:hypothetical protein